MRSMITVLAFTALVALTACKKGNNANNAQSTTSDTTTVQQSAPPTTDTVVTTTTSSVDTIHGKAPDTSKAGAAQDTTKGRKHASRSKGY